MLRVVKLATLGGLRRSGVFRLVANSRWRKQRLLILCYHGISLADEHCWRPGLYLDPRKLDQRLELLKKGGYSVLSLDEGLERLRDGALPARSVVITFDDGMYDFYKLAFPRLKNYGFPVTVYQTTYYTSCERPVFNLMCSYMLWKRRGEVIADGGEVGLKGALDLRNEIGRHKLVRGLIEIAERENMTGQQKDELAARLARFLKIDYDRLKAKRILHQGSRFTSAIPVGCTDRCFSPGCGRNTLYLRPRATLAWLHATARTSCCHVSSITRIERKSNLRVG